MNVIIHESKCEEPLADDIVQVIDVEVVMDNTVRVLFKVLH